MKIGVHVRGESGACSFYRACGPLGNLAKRFAGLSLKAIKSPDWNEIVDCDLIFMHSPASKEELEICKLCKFMGIPLWLDYDDNIFEIPPHNPAFAFYKKEEVNEFPKYADKISVSTPTLAAEFRPFGIISVIENAIPASVFDFCVKIESQYPGDKTTLAWRGSCTHDYDVMSNLSKFKAIHNSLATELDTHSDIYLFGDPPSALVGDIFKSNSGWADGQLYVKKTTTMMDYLQKFSRSRAAILYVPLDDNSFNRCKSNVSWLEASICGAATSVELVDGPFSNLPVIRGCSNKAERQEVVKSSRELVKKSYILEDKNDLRIELMNSLVSPNKRI